MSDEPIPEFPRYEPPDVPVTDAEIEAFLSSDMAPDAAAEPMIPLGAVMACGCWWDAPPAAEAGHSQAECPRHGPVVMIRANCLLPDGWDMEDGWAVPVLPATLVPPDGQEPGHTGAGAPPAPPGADSPQNLAEALAQALGRNLQPVPVQAAIFPIPVPGSDVELFIVCLFGAHGAFIAHYQRPDLEQLWELIGRFLGKTGITPADLNDLRNLGKGGPFG